jgi:hypothetical protein
MQLSPVGAAVGTWLYVFRGGGAGLGLEPKVDKGFLGDRPFRAISEWLLVGSHHCVGSSRARAGVGLDFCGKHCAPPLPRVPHIGSLSGVDSPAPGAPPPAPSGHKERFLGISHQNAWHKTPTFATVYRSSSSFLVFRSRASNAVLGVHGQRAHAVG